VTGNGYELSLFIGFGLGRLVGFLRVFGNDILLKNRLTRLRCFPRNAAPLKGFRKYPVVGLAGLVVEKFFLKRTA